MKFEMYWIGLSFMGLVSLASCGGKNASQNAPPPAVSVNVYTVQESRAVFYEDYPATVTALNQVEIRPQVSGYITGIFLKEGQHVKKGQKLYSIDQQQYEAAYQQSLANVNVAKANLEKVQQDVDRYTELAKQDAIAKQTLDHSLADLQSAKMQLEAARANTTSVQTNLRYTTIYAPFDGTIGISQVKLGTAVSPGQTLLNTISSDDPIAVDFAVDDKQISRFEQLQRNPAGKKDSTFTLILPGGIKYSYPGHISFLDRALDPQTGTITARLIFPNPSNILRPGLTCNLHVKNAGMGNSILIPFKAVVEQMGEYFVYVVDSSKAIQRKISTGVRISDKVLVKDGLKVNDQIVIDGTQKLHDGSLISIPAPGAGTDSAKKGSGGQTK